MLELQILHICNSKTQIISFSQGSWKFLVVAEIPGFPSIKKVNEGDSPFKKFWFVKLDNCCLPPSHPFPLLFPLMKRKSRFWFSFLINTDYFYTSKLNLLVTAHWHMVQTGPHPCYETVSLSKGCLCSCYLWGKVLEDFLELL